MMSNQLVQVPVEGVLSDTDQPELHLASSKE
jgi:hypothetical protein